MTVERHQQISELLARALEQPVSERRLEQRERVAATG